MSYIVKCGDLINSNTFSQKYLIFLCNIITLYHYSFITNFIFILVLQLLKNKRLREDGLATLF